MSPSISSDPARRAFSAPSASEPTTAFNRAPRGLLGESPVFRNSVERARRAGLAGSTVLITGESGTGKEGFARFIHESSSRRAGPFIPVNCAAVPETLIESELFGHARGAFTGAISARAGKFALADGGTLFLDEIGEMPPSMQVRLLRALQERTIEPVGGGAVRTDFRLIAATHRDLRAEVRAGRFRQDLWFRLHVIPLVLPPLRDRGRDVILLARHFLDEFNARHGAAFALTPEHERFLLSRDWPGNVRELANAMERAVVLSEGPVLTFFCEGGRPVQGVGNPLLRPRTRLDVEKEALVAALETSGGNRAKAAVLLGVSKRWMFYKIKEHGIR